VRAILGSDRLAQPASRDRFAILIGFAGILVAAWIYVVRQSAEMGSGVGAHSMMGSMQGMDMSQPWSAGGFGLLFEMWAVMMVAMMLPTAIPMTLVYAAVAKKAAAQHNPVAPTFVFVAGYAAVWTLFALVATGAQRALDQASLLSPTMRSNSEVVGGVLLIAAGLYQLTPLKRACLENCRAPANFIARNWRPGTLGAFRLGLRHGLYCLGCCWVLMGLLFVGGVMNLLWVAAIALFVLFEKTLPFAPLTGRLAGIAVAVTGVAVLAT
jgi:predicted metal-binding membrane protein